MPNGAEPDLAHGEPPGTFGCDFDLDGDEDEIGMFGGPPTWLPTAVPGSPGGMQDFELDGLLNDFMFNPCAVPAMNHPDCNFDVTPPEPQYPFPFSLPDTFPPTNTDCACVAFDVGNPSQGAPDLNESCDPVTGAWVDPDVDPDPDAPPPVPCFVPRCIPGGDQGDNGSPYYPIPRFTAPAEPSCDVPFFMRWGNGSLIPEVLLPEGESGWPVGDDDDDILPPADLVFDGPKEYDDLASSFYHTHWISGAGLNDPQSATVPAPVAVLADYGGDQLLGEVTTTSPLIADRNYYGHDKAALGSNGSSHDPDGLITPAGPLAGGDTAYFLNGAQILGFNGSADPIHGGPGFDGGNQLALELLTRRTDGKAPTEPFTGPASPDGRGFRDFNLDGMIDHGEGRVFGTENYVLDSFDFTTKNDGRESAAYPFNRDRVTEDVVEATDFIEDFDAWVNDFLGCGGTMNLADTTHIIFLPPGFPITTYFSHPSPSATLPINTVDNMPPEAGQKVRVEDMMRKDFPKAPQDMPFSNLVDLLLDTARSRVPVVDGEGRMVGSVSRDVAQKFLNDRNLLSEMVIAKDVATQDAPIVTSQNTLDQAIHTFQEFSCRELYVVDDPVERHVIGVVHKGDLMDAYQREIIKQNAGDTFAYGINHPHRMETVDVMDGYSIMEIEAPHHFAGKGLSELDLRNRFGVNVLAIKRPGGRGKAEDLQAAMPTEFAELIAYLKQHVSNIDDAVISVHCHNDLGLAVATPPRSIAPNRWPGTPTSRESAWTKAISMGPPTEYSTPT